MAEDLQQIGRFAGHQSEPTTPPEYRDPSRGFPSMFSRPNRHSTGLVNRGTRSLLTSPPSGMLPMRLAFDDQLPSLSGPGSRRNSDDDEKEEAVRQDPSSHRATKAYVLSSTPSLLTGFALLPDREAAAIRCKAVAVPVMGLKKRLQPLESDCKESRSFGSSFLPGVGHAQISILLGLKQLLFIPS